MADEEECQEGVTPASLANDKGYLSRKLHLTVLAMFLVVGMGIACHWSTGIGNQMQTIISGILGALAIFVGGNVATKFSAASLAKVVGPIRAAMGERKIEKQEDRVERKDIREDMKDAKTNKDARSDAKEAAKDGSGPPVENG